MAVFADLFLALTILGGLYYVASTWAMLHHFRARETAADAAPSVSLLKPVCGTDADLRVNLDSFLDQDYPDYEALFGVLEADDPAVPVIRDCLAGREPAQFYIGSEIDGANNKVRILDNLVSRARGAVIVITDADIRVGPDCLRRVTAPFADARVGLVTCMYRGVGAKTGADGIESLFMTAVFEPGAACAASLGLEFGLGALIAVRAEALEAIGGFAAIVDYLADDFQLAHRVGRAGWRVLLSDYVVEIALSGESFERVFGRILRWSRTLRVCSPSGYVGLAITYGSVWASLFLLASGFSRLGWASFVLVWAIRLSCTWVGSVRCLGDREFFRKSYLLLACDAISFAAWVGAFFVRTIHWRGRRLRVSKSGKVSAAK